MKKKVSPTPPRVIFQRAGPQDDDELRTLMQRNPTPGPPGIADLREPSYFESLCIAGRENEVLAARDEASGRMVGAATRSLKTAFINGRSVTLGRLGELRLEAPWRRGEVLGEGYRMLRERHRADGRVQLYVTTLRERDALARPRGGSGKGVLPAHHDLGRFHRRLIFCHPSPSHKRVEPPSGVTFHHATREAQYGLVEFLQREGARRQFFPVYELEDFSMSTGLLRGLRPDDIVLAVRGGRVIGSAAAWDQREFRQHYLASGWWRVLPWRMAYNMLGLARGWPRIPGGGRSIPFFHLALACVQDDDPRLFAPLLAYLVRDLGEKYPFFVAGFHERDPLSPVLRTWRGFSYISRMVMACWDDGEVAYRNLDDRAPYFETGAL